MLPPMDIWRCAIVRFPLAELNAIVLERQVPVWLPPMPPGCFRADPFGLWRGDRLYVFAEAYDYRSRVGHIDALTYDRDLRLIACETVLREPWHLSYPFVFEAEDAVWMLPEAYRSGTTTLYRASDFPRGWEAVIALRLDGPAIDATPLFHDGRWWLFYAPAEPKAARQTHLHVAWADRLTGPWHSHPGNPVRRDAASSRPGGTPYLSGATICLPVQDCRETYGGALRRLMIDELTPTTFAARDEAWLSAPAWGAPSLDGLHTASAAAGVTLIDVKRIERSWRGTLAQAHGRLRRRYRRTL